MGFLEALGNKINETFSVGENKTRSLDTDPTDPDHVKYFGKLGDFADKIDQTAQRSYIENGYIRNVRPRNLEILMQEPNVTICVKKRMFSSLENNFRLDMASEEERLFIRASKRLFQNKCNAIATYEKLSKIERIVMRGGILDDIMFPQIMSGIDALDALGVNIIDAKTRSYLETLRKLAVFSEPSQFTTWLTDRDSPFDVSTGEGNGVFELTMAASVDTTVSTRFNSGSANLTFEDPYQLMVVTNFDIDKAISDAASLFKGNNFFRTSEQELINITEDLKQQLTTIRLSRGAAPINFIISPETLIYKRVRAIIDGEAGEPTNVTAPIDPNKPRVASGEIIFDYNGGLLGIGDSISIDESAFRGANAVAHGTEEELLKNILKNLFKILALEETTKSQIKDFNSRDDIRYVREKMRLHYANKAIIQPMDVVHIFISSKTIWDDKVVGFVSNSFGGNDILKAIDTTVKNIQSGINDIESYFGGTKQNSDIEIEKNTVVGPDFPTWLYSMLRNDFTKQAAGTHVFAGIVFGEVSQSYNASSGVYQISVPIKDNAAYFEISNINIDPSVDVFNSTIYDPLTPFKVDFDVATGMQKGEIPPLLDENEKLLSSSMLAFKNGPLAGSRVSPDAYRLKTGEIITTGKSQEFRTILNDPNGFVYRWKTGIESLTFLGEPHTPSSFGTETAPKLTANPFAGQDAMNVLSLLITGQPYNYNNFIKAALDIGNLTRDDIVNGSGSRSYYKGLISQLTENNSIWGKFMPFKSLVVSEASKKFLLSGQVDLSVANQQINSLIEERARLFDALVASPNGQGFGKNPRITTANVSDSLPSDIKLALNNIFELDNKIATQAEYIYNKIKNSNLSDGSIRIFGDDISYNSTFAGTSDNNEEGRKKERINFRKKLYSLTQRRLWRVKSNTDTNLFIVDDQYDNNYDLMSFEKQLAGKLDLFNSQYNAVDSKIKSIIDILGLEVFADTQGNIQARPPAYNRIPSSVFRRMLRDRERNGVRIFPKSLESLFFNQIDGLVDRLEIIEAEIRLRSAMLGYASDMEATNFLNGSKIHLDTNSNFSSFVFITNESTFSVDNIRSIILETDIETLNDEKQSPLKEVTSKISSQLSSSNLFDVIAKIRASSVAIEQFTSTQSLSNRINNITNWLTREKGYNQETLLSTNRNSVNLTQSDTIKYLNDISNFISERQGVLLSLNNAIKNVSGGVALNKDPDVSKEILYPNTYGDKHIPEIILHMIEDEDFDDLGPGSGARYIIKDNQIMSLSISERPSEYTLVEVNGLFGEKFVPSPTSLDIGNGGNAVSTAFAVDYDMWQMYGFRAPQTFSAPYLSDPDSQCAPYAVFLLNLARKKILTASLTIIGNEFMQPGEVVYIESRDLLFYVDSVHHSFSYGGNFTTTLTLSYGHNPGEYIPTQLDIIGKALYVKKGQSNLIKHQRHGNANGDIHIGVLTIDDDTLSTFSPDLSALVSGTYAEENRKVLTKIMFSLAGGLAPSTNKQAKIELRTYFNNSEGIAQSENLQNIAGLVTTWLKDPSKRSYQTNGNIIPDNLPEHLQPADIDSLVNIVAIGETDSVSPSQQAWSMVSTIIDKSGSGSSDTDVGTLIKKKDYVMANRIIDVWVKFEDILNDVSTDRNTQSPSQAVTGANAVIDSIYFGKFKG